MRHLLVDADTILYRVGFSGPPSPAAACAQLGTYIDTIAIRAYRKYGISVTDTSICFITYFLTISDGVRYRDKFSKTVKYKEHRSSAPTPLYMKEMQDFVIRNLNTNVSYSSQREADDAVSIVARNYYGSSGNSDKYIIAGVDKDLLQIPGGHYNYVKDTAYSQSASQADRWFFYQLLMGDVADNIPGIKGVGPKKAEKILSKGSTTEQWWDLTVEEYAKAYPKHSENELCDMLYERGNMLWIQRRDEQEWYPPIPD
jgi:hypothetical protein